MCLCLIVLAFLFYNEINYVVCVVDGVIDRHAPAESMIDVDNLTNAVESINIDPYNRSRENGHGLLLMNVFGSPAWVDKVLNNVVEAAKAVSQQNKDEFMLDVAIAVTMIKVSGSINRIICVSIHQVDDANSDVIPSPSLDEAAEEETVTPVGTNESENEDDDDKTVNNWGDILGIPKGKAVVEDCIFV